MLFDDFKPSFRLIQGVGNTPLHCTNTKFHISNCSSCVVEKRLKPFLTCISDPVRAGKGTKKRGIRTYECTGSYQMPLIFNAIKICWANMPRSRDVDDNLCGTYKKMLFLTLACTGCKKENRWPLFCHGSGNVYDCDM